MSEPVEAAVARLAGASRASRQERIQTLWGGYGEAARYTLDDGRVVVVKHVRPGRGSGRSHERKLRSYAVEQAWYTRWASRCGPACRVPRVLGVEASDGWLFVLEDLDAAGFADRSHHPSERRLRLCLRWLAALHAEFLGEAPAGLWPSGTYWHLETRPDELAAMAPGPLQDAAAAIARRLGEARFRTLVHGDAKPANFCFAPDSSAVAAVDFQYVGGGCGVQDVAYLLSGEDRRATEAALDVYFLALREAVDSSVDGAALEAEWRELFPWAWADFHRFLAGWAPSWRVHRHGRSLTDRVLASLRA